MIDDNGYKLLPWENKIIWTEPVIYCPYIPEFLNKKTNEHDNYNPIHIAFKVRGDEDVYWASTKNYGEGTNYKIFTSTEEYCFISQHYTKKNDIISKLIQKLEAIKVSIKKTGMVQSVGHVNDTKEMIGNINWCIKQLRKHLNDETFDIRTLNVCRGGNRYIEVISNKSYIRDTEYMDKIYI